MPSRVDAKWRRSSRPTAEDETRHVDSSTECSKTTSASCRVPRFRTTVRSSSGLEYIVVSGSPPVRRRRREIHILNQSRIDQLRVANSSGRQWRIPAVTPSARSRSNAYMGDLGGGAHHHTRDLKGRAATCSSMSLAQDPTVIFRITLRIAGVLNRSPCSNGSGLEASPRPGPDAAASRAISRSRTSSGCHTERMRVPPRIVSAPARTASASAREQPLVDQMLVCLAAAQRPESSDTRRRRDRQASHLRRADSRVGRRRAGGARPRFVAGTGLFRVASRARPIAQSPRRAATSGPDRRRAPRCPGRSRSPLQFPESPPRSPRSRPVESPQCVKRSPSVPGSCPSASIRADACSPPSSSYELWALKRIWPLANGSLPAS